MHLNTRTTAALIGRSKYTLQRARHDRPDLDMPPSQKVGKRSVVYAVPDVLGWAKRRGVRLDWEDLPLCYVLPAVRAHRDAGLPLPAALAAAMRRAPLSADHT